MVLGPAAAIAVLLVAAAAGEASVPRSFFGVVPQAPLSEGDLDRMAGTVGTVRVPALWAQFEPRPGEYEFGALDRLVEGAAERRIRVLPFVYGSPAWLTRDPARPPHRSSRGRAEWAGFLRALVDRYGPRGELWEGDGRALPIRRWQIWNEPNFPVFWRPRPSARGYAQLLRIAARAVREADRGARIVTAGVAPVEGGPRTWVFLRRLYRVRGVRASFDAVGLHPYASSRRSLGFQVRMVRREMARAGDAGTPLEVTEIGIASSGPMPSPMVVSRAGQATFLRQAYNLLIENRRRWRVSGAAWFTWRDSRGYDEYCVFCEGAGLLDATGVAKPAWWQLVGLSAASAGRGGGHG